MMGKHYFLGYGSRDGAYCLRASAR
jgi:hypothetical protein